MLTVRPAKDEDVPGIMRVERETFGDIGEDAMAAEAVMRERVGLCNRQRHSWFWVAEKNGEVVGDLILQPTGLTPEECTSWGAATDDGTLRRTFDLRGENVYVVSFAVCANAPHGTSYLLAHAAFLEWFRMRKKLFMFCSRMPGFKAMHDKNGISPEEYWRLRRRDGSPRDSMLHLYWEMTGGSNPHQFLRDGFPPDEESGGHGVLFAADDPVRALRAAANLIHAHGVREGLRNLEEVPHDK